LVDRDLPQVPTTLKDISLPGRRDESKSDKGEKHGEAVLTLQTSRRRTCHLRHFITSNLSALADYVPWVQITQINRLLLMMNQRKKFVTCLLQNGTWNLLHDQCIGRLNN
jgi:hypothetical protein